MKAVSSSVMLLNFYRITRHHFPEYSTLHNYFGEHLESNKLILIYKAENTLYMY
jgi:hypothetical protein